MDTDRPMKPGGGSFPEPLRKDKMKKKLLLLLIIGLIPMRAYSAGTSEVKEEVPVPRPMTPLVA